METYKGDVEITDNNKKEWEKKLKGVEKIGGYLYIYSNVELKAPSLKSVGGDLYIYSNVELKSLKSVGGYLSIYSNVELKSLKSVGGYLSIYSNVELKAPSLKSVGGGLYINSNVELKAPSLKSVGGDLYIYSNVELKSLKSVGGGLYINSNVELKSLKSVGGYLSINSNVELKSLKSVGGYLSINSNVELKAPSLKSVGGGLHIYSKISNDLAIRLTNNCFRHQWYLSDKANNSLLRTKFPKVKYYINNVYFEKELFDKVRKDQLTPDYILTKIKNLEQKRIAWEMMDKTKVKKMKGLKVIDTQIDEQGKKMYILELQTKVFDTPFYFLQCKCPTGREYFVETRQKDCWSAKMGSFGLPADTRFGKEY